MRGARLERAHVAGLNVAGSERAREAGAAREVHELGTAARTVTASQAIRKPRRAIRRSRVDSPARARYRASPCAIPRASDPQRRPTRSSTASTSADASRWSPAARAASGKRRRGYSRLERCRGHPHGARRRRRARPSRRRSAARPATSACQVEELELGSLAHVRAFAARVLARHPRLDILIDNAGVMACPFAQDGRRLRAPVRLQPPRPFSRDLPARAGVAAGDAARFVSLSSRGHHIVAGRVRRPAVRAAARTTSGRPTGRRRPPTCSSPSASSGASARAASTPSRCTPARS